MAQPKLFTPDVLDQYISELNDALDASQDTSALNTLLTRLPEYKDQLEKEFGLVLPKDLYVAVLDENINNNLALNTLFNHESTKDISDQQFAELFTYALTALNNNKDSDLKVTEASSKKIKTFLEKSSFYNFSGLNGFAGDILRELVKYGFEITNLLHNASFVTAVSDQTESIKAAMHYIRNNQISEAFEELNQEGDTKSRVAKFIESIENVDNTLDQALYGRFEGVQINSLEETEKNIAEFERIKAEADAEKTEAQAAEDKRKADEEEDERKANADLQTTLEALIAQETGGEVNGGAGTPPIPVTPTSSDGTADAGSSNPASEDVAGAEATAKQPDVDGDKGASPTSPIKTLTIINGDNNAQLNTQPEDAEEEPTPFLWNDSDDEDEEDGDQGDERVSDTTFEPVIFHLNDQASEDAAGEDDAAEQATCEALQSTAYIRYQQFEDLSDNDAEKIDEILFHNQEVIFSGESELRKDFNGSINKFFLADFSDYISEAKEFTDASIITLASFIELMEREEFVKKGKNIHLNAIDNEGNEFCVSSKLDHLDKNFGSISEGYEWLTKFPAEITTGKCQSPTDVVPGHEQIAKAFINFVELGCSEFSIPEAGVSNLCGQTANGLTYNAEAE